MDRKQNYYSVILFLIPGLLFAQNWTVTVKATTSDNSGNSIVSLHFVSDQGGIYDIDDHIPFGAPPNQVSDFAATTISQLNAQQVVFSGVPAVGQTITPTAVAITPPDPNAAIKAAFQNDYALLKQMQTAISHNILTTADLTYVAQLSKVTNELAANESILLPLIQSGP